MKALLVFLTVITCGVFPLIWHIWYRLDGAEYDGPFEWIYHRERVKREAKSKGPEEGTIRIVEKMDEDGETYYIVERYEGSKVWKVFLRHERDWSVYSEAVRVRQKPIAVATGLWFIDTQFATVEDAQTAANERVEEDRADEATEAEKAKKKAHHKVMGEFKP